MVFLLKFSCCCWFFFFGNQCPIKRGKIVLHNQECKKKNNNKIKKKKPKEYLHIFSRHETSLSILATIHAIFNL